MQKRKVVIENEEGTAKSEYVELLLNALLEVLKNDPPILVAACVTILILVLVVCAICSISSGHKYFFIMVQKVLEYIHNIVILVIYTKRKGNGIDNETCKKIDCKIEGMVIALFSIGKNQKQEKQKKDPPALRSGSAFKKRSQRQKKH